MRDSSTGCRYPVCRRKRTLRRLSCSHLNTWLQTNGVPPRMAQELMRHSDRRLTDQVYLDTSLLPLQETMRSIDGFAPLTQILTHISGKTCHLESRVGKRVRVKLQEAL